MGHARLRKIGNGGLKFKRSLSIDWATVDLSPENLVGSDGILVHAITFGDPYASNTRGPISILNISFCFFKTLSNINLTSSTGRIHKIIDGPFFKLYDQTLDNFKSLMSLGAMTNNLPQEEWLDLTIKNLTPDKVYQINCAFFDEKKKASPLVTLNPGDHQIAYDRQQGCIAIGVFTAPTEEITIKISSLSIESPHINALVLREIGDNPRTTASRIKTIAGLKS